MNIKITREGPCYPRRLYIEVPLAEGYTEEEVTYIQEELVRRTYSSMFLILDEIEARRANAESR
jgi:hypothetical protein